MMLLNQFSYLWSWSESALKRATESTTACTRTHLRRKRCPLKAHHEQLAKQPVRIIPDRIQPAIVTSHLGKGQLNDRAALNTCYPVWFQRDRLETRSPSEWIHEFPAVIALLQYDRRRSTLPRCLAECSCSGSVRGQCLVHEEEAMGYSIATPVRWQSGVSRCCRYVSSAPSQLRCDSGLASAAPAVSRLRQLSALGLATFYFVRRRGCITVPSFHLIAVTTSVPHSLAAELRCSLLSSR